MFTGGHIELTTYSMCSPSHNTQTTVCKQVTTPLIAAYNISEWMEEVLWRNLSLIAPEKIDNCDTL